MRSLVLDGAGPQEVLGSIEEASRKAGFETEAVHLAGSSVKGCKACFVCWVKTPGECAFDDDARAIAKKWVGSDLVVFVTPAVCGTYSPPLKRALERMLPLFMPYFKKMKGKTHHPHRYEGRPGLLVFGLGATDAENDNLRDLVERNAKGLVPRFHEVVVLDGKEDGKKIAAAFDRAKEGMA
jgi:multimeric flavodoxin WrbA